jgi:hypothetical protein
VALAARVAEAQKPGGVLIMSHFDSPASMSMHEEALQTKGDLIVAVHGHLVEIAVPRLARIEAELLGRPAGRQVPSAFDVLGVLLTGQLKEIYIDGELEMVDTTDWFPKVLRKDFTVGMVVSENGLDDPDQNFYENYACGAARNYGGYCNQEVDALIDRQSLETDLEKRRRLVWEIERKLIEDDVRPVLFHPRGAVCNQPWVKGMTQMVNGIYNGSRFEDVWWTNSCHTATRAQQMGRPAAKGRKDRNEAKTNSTRRRGSIARRLARHCAGISSKSGWHSEDVYGRQPSQHVDPRGSNGLCRATDDGGFQQPRHV